MCIRDSCIAGLLDLTDGQIWIEDDNVTWKEPKDRHIGMVFQSYALYPSMTVEKNLSFGLRMMGTAKDLINEKIKKAANLLQINELLKRKPSQLSGGQRQRLAIARAFYRNSKLLVLDEATSALDNKTESEIMSSIDLVSNNCTLIIIAHRLSTVMNADMIYEFNNGQIIHSGTFKELCVKSDSFKDLKELEKKILQ